MPAPTAASATNRRKATTDKLAARKRAPIACQFCRLRKTRCDGIKPVCGFCKHHEAQCVWGVATDEIASTPAEKEILQRLDELKDLLSDARQAAPHVAEPQYSTPTPQTQERPATPITAASQNTTLDPLANLASPFTHTQCEKVLAWPIFQSVVNPNDLAVESFVLECDNSVAFEDTMSTTSPETFSDAPVAGLDIQTDQVLPLCRKFLEHVHPRNPMLDEAQLIRYAKHVAEYGLDWDGPSCLVVCKLSYVMF
jgi:hypothetical protein